MALFPRLVPLKGVVRHYSWGGFDLIPRLLQVQNSQKKPFAEYWLGAHPQHPSTLPGGKNLHELIQQNESACLGREIAGQFHSLPYLLKLLDVRQMLSIQVHPDKNSAARGFAEENKKGIPLQAPYRNYKDANHKPELMVALGEFWLLHGFKEPEALQKILLEVPELNFLQGVFGKANYKKLYETVMGMPQDEVNQRLEPLVNRILSHYNGQQLQKHQEDFWAARAAKDFCRNGHVDRGIFSIYFFNLLCLQKGQGIFQPAGLPHAYLEGQNVEVMANSDNVLRAGLTDKHIDVAELMKHVRFEATRPEIIHTAAGNEHSVYATAAREFELHRYEWPAGHREVIRARTAEIYFVLDGILTTSEGTELKRGAAGIVFYDAETEFRVQADAQLFRVTVPV